MLGAVHWSLVTLAAALRWSAPAECPPAAALEERLAATVNADVSVTRDGRGRYVATVRVGAPDADGLRTLDEATCDVLADAVVTVLSLSLGAPAPPPPPSPVDPVPAPVPAVTPVTPVTPVAQVTPETPRSDPRFAAGLLLRAEHGTLPSTSVAGGIGLAWYPLRSVRVEGSVLRAFAQTEAVSGQPYGGTFHLTSGTLRSCWSALRPARTISLGPCVGVEIDHVNASGYGSTHVGDGSATWWAPSAGALLRWEPLRRFAVTALGDVAFAASRRSFVISDGGAIYQPAIAAPRGQIAAEVRF